MNTFFSWALPIAYFSVFLVGLLACYHIANGYFKSRKFFKAGSTCALAILAICGLIKAFAGVYHG